MFTNLGVGLRSIKHKLIVSTFILVAAIVAFALVYFPEQQRRQAFLALENELEVLCETLALTIALGFEEDNYEAMQVAFDFVKRNPLLDYIAVYGVDGELIAAFPDPLPGSAEPIVKPGLVEGRETVAYCSAITLRGQAYGFVTISKSLSSFNQNISDSRYDTLLIGLLILSISLGLVYLIARMVAEPLNLLTGATQRVARGEYSVRVDIARRDETGTLATNFNRMTNALQTHTEELSRASEAAEAANRAKSTFLANMSHEIRTPMNAILGFAQIVGNDPDLDDRHRKSVGTIRQSGEHLLKLINDILDISKIEAGHMQLNRSEFDLKVLVDALGDMFGMRCQQTGLVWELESEVPAGCVEGDEGKLRQVLINLVGNAVKFTEMGTVKLKVGALGDNRYAFEVRDTGPGIPEDKQAAIFEPFQQEEEGLRQGGTGLGLAISMGHVEMMGGSIALESRLGEGSRFMFTLELPQGQTPMRSTDTTDWSCVRHLADGQTLRALVVDDVKTNRELLEHMLTQIGVQVETAENGAEGLEQVGLEMPDIVFLDIRMPVMDGPEMLKRMRHEHGEEAAEVVAVTASVFDHQRQEYLDMGFAAFLSKPLESDQIYACLAELLGVKFDFAETESNDVSAAAERDWTEVVLPPDVYADLAAAVSSHSITGLRKGLDRLKENAPDLAAHLGELASQFDMTGIKTVLDEISPQ